MAYPINFSRDVAAGWLEAIRRGDPLVAPDGRWNVSSMVSLAGTMFFGALSHGPVKYMGPSSSFEALPREHQEAVEERFFAELHAAIEFCGRLASAINDGAFDEVFESRVVASVQQQDCETAIVRYSGFKDVSGEDDRRPSTRAKV
jgi:hypothetical protein